MDELELPTVNRSALIVRIKEPFVTWANQLTDRSPEEKKHPLHLEELNQEPTVYLIPEIYDSEEWDAYLEGRWPILFEHMLTGWTSDEELWPERRTLKMLLEWFDLSVLSLVQDLPNTEPIGYSEY